MERNIIGQENLSLVGGLQLYDRTSSPINTIGTQSGVLYTKQGSPNTLMFVDNSGSEFTITPTGADALEDILLIGNTTGTSDIVLSTGTSLTAETALSINTPNQVGANASSIQCKAGNSDTGVPGAIQLIAGNATAISGGNVSISGGSSSTASGGAITLSTGGSTNGNGGNLLGTAADSDTGTGGSVILTAGDSSTAAPGNILLNGGSSGGVATTGGAINLTGGQAVTGGTIQLAGGLSPSGGVGEYGGNVALVPGNSISTSNYGTIVIGGASQASKLSCVSDPPTLNAAGTLAADSTSLAGGITVNAASTVTLTFFHQYNNGGRINVIITPTTSAAATSNSYVSASSSTSFSITNPSGSAAAFNYFVIQSSWTAV